MSKVMPISFKVPFRRDVFDVTRSAKNYRWVMACRSHIREPWSDTAEFVAAWQGQYSPASAENRHDS